MDDYRENYGSMTRRFTRRDALRGMAAGVAGLGAGVMGMGPRRLVHAATKNDVSRVSFVTGKERRENVYRAMKPFEDEVRRAIRGKQVVIKPNFVVNDTPLVATQPDAIRGVLDFLAPIYDGKVIVGESTISRSGTMQGYENYGYTSLPDEYNVELVDFNKTPFTRKWILSEHRQPLGIDIIDAYLDPDNYIISVTRLKTHDTVVATLTLKNIVMGSPYNSYEKGGNQKSMMHEGAPLGLHYNMFLIAQEARPDFAVLDGTEGMEGNGPVRGTAVDHGVALAGPDFVSVDRMGVELMGVDYSDVAYLQWCANAGMGIDDTSRIEVMGPDIARHRIEYKLHENIDWQRSWKTG